MELKSFRLKNFRAFEDTRDIELKPFTVFVGKNGCGKSTITRFLPLLKQGSNSHSSTPFNWYGTEVDFGDLETVLNKNNKEFREIEISLEFSLPSYFWFIDDFDNFIKNIRKYKEENIKTTIPLKIKYKIEKNQERDLIKEFSFSIRNFNEIILKYEKNDKTTKNLYIMEINSQKYYFQMQFSNLFPNNIELVGDTISNKEKESKNFFKFNRIEHILSEIKNKILESLIKSQNESENKKLILSSFREIDSYYSNIGKIASNKTNCAKVRNFYGRNKEILSSVFTFVKTMSIFDNVDLKQSLYNKILYSAPLRAKGSRFYRLQNLETDIVTSIGDNIHNIIASFSEEQKEKFHQLCDKIINAKVSIKSIDMNRSIEIEIGDKSYNMADVGFGYSQILPIIVQLFLLSQKEGIHYYCIEQPELHLHPALQAKLVELMIEINKNNQIRFIIETHSETIIKKIANSIIDQKIKTENLSLNVFNISNNIANIKQSFINKEKGTIENWPLGFFDYMINP